MNDCSEIAVAYTYFRGDDSTGAEATGTAVLQPLVFSPFTPDANPDQYPGPSPTRTSSRPSNMPTSTFATAFGVATARA